MSRRKTWRTWNVWRVLIGRGLVDNLGPILARDADEALALARRMFDEPEGERLEVELETRQERTA